MSFEIMRAKKTTVRRFPWGTVAILHQDAEWDRWANMNSVNPKDCGYSTRLDFTDGCVGGGQLYPNQQALDAALAYLQDVTPQIMECLSIRAEVPAAMRPLVDRANVATERMFRLVERAA